MKRIFFALSLCLYAKSLFLNAQPAPKDGIIKANWESLKSHYEVPQWFIDGKIGVWMHWGISSH